MARASKQTPLLAAWLAQKLHQSSSVKSRAKVRVRVKIKIILHQEMRKISYQATSRHQGRRTSSGRKKREGK